MIFLKWLFYTILVSLYGWIVMIPAIIIMVVRRFIFGDLFKRK